MSYDSDRELIRSLFLNDTPLIDVRAPVEFTQGAFPSAVNHPLMNDQERHEVGICYKNHGQDAAIALGQQLVSGSLKEQRIAYWLAFAQQHPNAYLYCFRGGLRSRTSQQWLHDSGIDIAIIPGGYKAMRRLLIDELEQAIEQSRFILLGGKTGTGKTRLLKQLDGAIDLEALAHHRGSSFGRFPDGQPSQIDFENHLSICLMKYRHRGIHRFWLEDEGRLIGRLSLPQSLQKKMKQAPLVMLDETMDFRINSIIKDYVIDLLSYYRGYYQYPGNAESVSDEQIFERFADYLQDSLLRIKKRLGGERYQAIERQLSSALLRHKQSGNIDGHRIWIDSLLRAYYDPMYSYQIEQKHQRLIYTGNSHQILADQSKILGSLS